MTTKVFSVKSSDGVNEYRVAFAWDGASLYLTCDCKAGSIGQWCKHKEGLALGDVSLLTVTDDLTEVLKWVEASPLSLALLHLREAEARITTAQREAKVAKKTLADLVNPQKRHWDDSLNTQHS